MAGTAVVSTRRLERFARERGLLFDPEPPVRRSPTRFRHYDEQRPLGRLGVPGTTGFEVEQRIETLNLGGGDNSAAISRCTWAVFTLRTGPAGSERAAQIASRIMPHGWNAVLDDDELVLWTYRRTRLTSSSLWEWLFRTQQALEPMLARPASRIDRPDGQQRAIES